MSSATAREFQRAAQTLGFVRRRQTGSHERWTHGDGRSVTIPLHSGRDIGRNAVSLGVERHCRSCRAACPQNNHFDLVSRAEAALWPGHSSAVCLGDREVQAQSTGTRRFNSSNQFCTTMICGAAA